MRNLTMNQENTPSVDGLQLAKENYSAYSTEVARGRAYPQLATVQKVFTKEQFTECI